MKKQTRDGSQYPASKILGAIPVHANAEDASGLVGGIVEKGFSDLFQNRTSALPAAPRPTVLPFPVARHRSCGPVWAPNGIDKNDDLDLDRAEDECFDCMKLSAGVANPVQKKKKKFGFNRWKEMLKSNGEPVLHVSNAKEMQQNGSAFEYKTVERTTDSLSCISPELDDSILVRTPNATQWNHQLKERSEEILPASSRNSINVDNVRSLSDQISESGKDVIMMNEPLSMNALESENIAAGEELTLRDQIEAENYARLAKMSTEEIAAAQAEVMAKLSPELVNTFRKRGETKAKRKKKSFLPAAGSQADVMQFEKEVAGDDADSRRNGKCVSELNPVSDKNMSHVPRESIAGDKQEDESEKVFPDKTRENCSIWEFWNRRVERVRHLRFSLDGNVVRCTSANESEHTPSGTGYNTENVTERDILRTEGDPAGAGYSIKEAIALTRSVIPGQRTLALHLISAILDLAMRSILRNTVSSDCDVSDLEDYVDGEAIWAFCFGPETELALSLRMCLDDNHKSVVLACAKAIHCALNCDMNEKIFDILERTSSIGSKPFTAPVFRCKPNINSGFFHGGFWKYNAKPSNIFPLDGRCMGDEFEGQGEPTIRDDLVVAEQDFAAGLVRMGILSRINYLLETDPAAPLDEYLISILISIARHSPTCAAAVMASGDLVLTVAKRFASEKEIEVNSCKIKTVVLIKVLAQVEGKNCLALLKNGIFHSVTWQLYRYQSSLGQWLNSGTEACKIHSALLVEQLRLWKVFVLYGFCRSDFYDLFPSLLIWLALPPIEMLVTHDMMNAYCAVTREAYLLLDVVARGLPNFYSHEQKQSQYAWSWGDAGRVIDLSMEWINVKSIPHLLRPLNHQKLDGSRCDVPDSAINSVIWVISSVLSMLTSVLKALIGDNAENFPKGHFPWLPEFVTKIGLAVAGTGILSFSGANDKTFEACSIADYFYQSRFQGREEWSVSSVCCLQGMVQVAAYIDKIIRHSNLRIDGVPSEDDEILANGILRSFRGETRCLLSNVAKSINSYWRFIRNVEVFGRGGPSPGVGVGWGASGGGYWSLKTLIAQQDAKLLCYLLEIPEFRIPEDSLEEAGEKEYTMQMLFGALATCLIVHPGNGHFVEQLLKFMFQVPILKQLSVGIHRFLLNKGRSPFQWTFEADEYESFANVLFADFREKWLGMKKKRKSADQKSLEAIQEHDDLLETSSLTVEWASQRLPLPAHWFLTFTVSESSVRDLEVPKSGLFFLLGLETVHTFIERPFESFSPVKSVPVVWKLHAMSVVLLSGMTILAEEKSRDVYAALQDVYGEFVDEQRLPGTSYLKFQSEIHENYSDFIDRLVEQFAAESYGDILFGKQVGIYLHGSVEASVRLSMWKALHNSRALELLPPLSDCFANAEGYLQPIQDEERMLEAYAKSWTNGALDKAESRDSMTFKLALHHLSSYIFGNGTGMLRDQLVKLLLRDCSRKRHHEGMMLKLICYGNGAAVSAIEAERRLQLLNEICKEKTDTVERLHQLFLTVM